MGVARAGVQGNTPTGQGGRCDARLSPACFERTHRRSGGSPRCSGGDGMLLIEFQVFLIVYYIVNCFNGLIAVIKMNLCLILMLVNVTLSLKIILMLVILVWMQGFDYQIRINL